MIFDSYKRVINAKRERVNQSLQGIEKTLLGLIPAKVRGLKFKRLEELGFSLIDLIEKEDEKERLL